MKKSVLSYTAFAIILVLLLTPLLAACGIVSLKLATPQLNSDDKGIVSWDKIPAADEYEICVYTDDSGQKGELVSCIVQQANSYALSKTGIFWVGVKALSQNSRYITSDESLIKVERKSTQEDVEVPEKPTDPDEPEEPVNPDPENPEPEEPEDVLPSTMPAVELPVGAVTKNNYYKAGSKSDLVISLTKETVFEGQLLCNNTLLSDDYFRYDKEKNQITLKASYFTFADSGSAYNFRGRDTEGYEFEFYVQVVNILPEKPEVPTYGYLIYNKKSQEGGLTVKLNSANQVKALSVDGVKVDDSTTGNYVLNSDNIYIKDAYLSKLAYGMHTLEIFTHRGVVDVGLFVYSTSIMCYDLHFDFDRSYPDVYLEWSLDYPVSRYEVVIDDMVYDSKTYPMLFEGNSFKATGLLSINDYVCVKTYLDSESKPATSESVTWTTDLASLDEYLDYDNGFEYLGKKYNYYISNVEEMNAVAYYMILFYDEAQKKDYNIAGYNSPVSMVYSDIYPDKDEFSLYATQTTNVEKVKSLFGGACSTYKEAINYSWITTASENGGFEVAIRLKSDNSPLYDSTTSYKESNLNEFHLKESSRPNTFDSFKINEITQTATVKTSDQLYFAVEAGFRPVPVEGSEAESVYNAAKDVARKYIDDSMTDYQKVHAIYDWLGANVIYDYDLLTEMSGIKPGQEAYNKFYSYDSFYLEGVFQNGVAVCNGIAKAFVLLCAIEGIPAVKVNGTANGAAHAWNKVYIDGKWYIVDSTWSNVKSGSILGGKTEAFTHEYLLITNEKSVADGRVEQTEDTKGYYCYDPNYVYTTGYWA